MTVVVFATGAAAAIGLIPLLLSTHVDPRLRIWPTPGPGSWQSVVFWTLFRLLNVAVLACALVGFAIGGAIYGYALLALGRVNTYCSQGGLVTHGIYRWTRNPQYATIIPAYMFLALAADNGPTYVLSSALLLVYGLMAMVEEPWLEAAYGDAYRRYCRRVPRFFNWRRAIALGHCLMRRWRAWPEGSWPGRRRNTTRSRPAVVMRLRRAAHMLSAGLVRK
jgi:protein-S-isoprenylcysteine O-methyltransferase Ste14